MTPPSPSPVDTVVLDLDGTLVDSVYVHTTCWRDAFRDVGVEVSSHHLHRAIGMGSDRLVPHVAGEAVERALGDEIRARHAHHLDHRFHEIAATPGAAELLDTLRSRGLRLVVASSGARDQTDRLLDLVEGASAALETVITGSDADQSKPDGELVRRALDAVGAEPGRAVLLGDTVWDARSAADAGVACLGILTGGITEAELRGAGCIEVYDTPADLTGGLDRSALLG
ncbi:HAD family hydrolase [Nocardioides sp.]|uniref:HAD family hydrolase n=1 Tax=Nocardioides sp. TaxID=35761 RepID=UPI002734EBDB|nr:HAD family hydrolase [Nocardioides sp.]MDP3890354.1 HAD family hydrolase [Nocardioides sp.]